MTVTSPPDTERLSILNPFPHLQPGPTLLHELIAAPSTSGTALEYHNKDGLVVRLSYQQLHQQTDGLAKIVTDLTTHSEHHIVPVLLPQCAALYISQVAILKAGAAFCPLNLDVPEDRLKFILNDISASIIITTPELSPKLDCFPDLIQVVLAHDGSIKHVPTGLDKTEPSLPQGKTTDPAYIMYTSGSTGTPKAVCISHKAATQSLLAHDRFIPHFSRFLQFANPTFDVSVFEIFFPLFRAATLVSCERTFMLSDLPKVIGTLSIDAAELTPSVVASLVRARASVPMLRTLLTIGEMLNHQTVKEFAGDDSDLESPLFGMYGPTEAAIHCTLQPRFRRTDSVNTIGVPLDTVSCFVIRPVEDDRPSDHIDILPFGEVGELAVGGHQLADGYLNREEQTKAAFVRHPKYGRLYRTGDKARMTSSGLLECVGRISKGQVKLRGQRIELGEIEHAASKADGVHATSAGIIDGQLVLFCVADIGSTKLSNVEAICRRWLPKAMIPSDIVILEDFPYLPSGKIDQRALESAYRAQGTSETGNCEMTINDSRLFDLVATTIGGNVKSTSSLAASGLDSLKAIQLATRIRQCGYPQLSAVDILLSSTYIRLEELVVRAKDTSQSVLPDQQRSAQQQLRSDVVADLSPDLRKDVSHVAPCTELQDAMLVETVKDKHAYINSVTLDLPTGLEYDQCVSALSTVAAHHSALRTGFLATSRSTSSFVQIVWNTLLPTQHRKVSAFETSIDVTEVADFLLRPLCVQFSGEQSRPQALIHLHHAMYDQWSLDILVDDLYRAINDLDLTSSPQFSEVAWQNSLNSGSEDTAVRFWKSYMTGVTSTRLPNLTGKMLPSATQVYKREAGISRTQLLSLAADLSVSEPVISQTAFAYLLGLYAGQTDVCTGSVFSGRTAAIENVQDIFGPMLATLPVRVSVDSTQRLCDAAKAVQDSNRLIMAHSTLSLAKVKRAAGMDPSVNLFDSVFVWQSSSRERIEQDSVVLVDTEDFVEFNLIFEIEPRDDCYLLKATYRSNILPESHVELFFDQFEHILNAVILDRHCTLGGIFADSAEEPLVSIYNPKPTTRDCSGGLPKLMSAAFKQYADRPAILFADNLSGDQMSHTLLTFSELDIRSNRLAHHLLASGLQPSGLVLIIMEKSVELYVGILATIKCGCGYLPVTPGTPFARIQKAIVDCGITHALCDSNLAESIRSMNVPDVISVPNDEADHRSTSHPEVHAELEDVAYAIWTSGTTGTPKGVMVTQENIVSNILDLGDMYPTTHSSRLLQSCNQSFDVSVFEIFFTWSRGMCLCSAKNDVLFRDIENAIRLMIVTHLSMTPTVAALVDPSNVPKVEFLVTAGEPVTAQVFRRWAGRGLWQGYGPSETTNICSVRPAVKKDDAINNIGPSFPNTSTFVLPTSGEFTPLPRGALGELCFGGQQVFRGYQNLPEITASKIIVHPKYGRIYKSGDLGRLASDGSILIEGRIDSQRKIRGQRIELSEITSTILKTSDVVDAVVVISGSAGNERLIAYWVPSDRLNDQYAILDSDADLKTRSERIKKDIIDTLPVYMVPTALVPVTALPRTGQGKIDTKRLMTDVNDLSSAYFDEGEEEDGAEPESLNEVECKIRAVISQTLGVVEAQIHRQTSLIRLGLDSVSAIKLATRIRSDIGAQLDVSSVLKNPKLGQLASLVSDHAKHYNRDVGRRSRLASFISPAERSSIDAALEKHHREAARVLPCTPLQIAMLSGSSASSYSNRTVLRMKISEQDMRSHWEVLFARHQILRTIFLSTDIKEQPFIQVVLKDAEFPWKTVDCDVDGNKLLGTSVSTADLPADSLKLPYYFEICRSSSGDYLVINMHHALYDANAMAVMLDEVEQLVNQQTLGSPVQFDSFLEVMMNADQDKADGFFNDMLSGLTPRLFPAVSETSSTFATHVHSFAVATDDIQRYCHAHEVSLLSLCQAAWSTVLSTAQGVEDICFGNVVSGRSVPVDGIERLVAPCFNTVPVRINLGASRTLAQLTKDLHHVNVETLAHQLTSLRHIQQRLFNGLRIFDSLVLLQQEPRPLDSSIWEFVGEKGDMDFPCIVEVIPSKDRMTLSIHYGQNLFNNDGQVRSICEHFSEAFTSLLRYPLRDVSKLSFSHSHDIRDILKTNRDKDKNIADDTADEDSHWSQVESTIREAFLAFSNSPPSKVTKTTTIYRLGLDSISAIQAAKLLRSKDLDVTAADILENPSVAALAKYCNGKTATKNQSSMPPKSFDFAAFEKQHRTQIAEKHGIQSSSIEAVRPCSPLQTGMLTSSARSEGSNYLNHFAYQVTLGNSSSSELEKAWNACVEAHVMLRTGFVEIEDPKFSFAMVTYKDHHREHETTLNYRTSEFDIKEIARRNGRSILEQSSLPPWRCHFIHLPDKIIMHLTMHHALYDAESIGQILRQFEDNLLNGKKPENANINEALGYILQEAEPSKAKKDFWTTRLKQANPTKFPNLHPVVTSAAGIREVSLAFSMPQSRLDEVCSHMGISVQSAFQAAWAKILSAYTGEEQVTFGVVTSGRNSSSTEHACFPCINTLPVTCKTSADGKGLLQQFTEFNAASQRHGQTPLTLIQDWIGLPGEVLFDTLFAFQKPMQARSLGTLHLIHEEPAINFPVSLEVEHHKNDSLRLRTTFDVAVIPEAQAQMMLSQIEALALELVDASSPPEKTTDLVSIIHPKDPVIQTDMTNLLEMFDTSVARNPDRTALEFISVSSGGPTQTKTWSYKELDACGNQVADLLLKKGVKPGSVVALCSEKCAEAAFAFVGIVKAGCTILGIDATAPLARKEFIISDSKASAVLCSSGVATEFRAATSSCAIVDLHEDLSADLSRLPPRDTPRADGASVCYILYTSGTTGTPKGCELTHENTVQALLSFERLFHERYDSSSVWCQFASYHFDVAILEHFWTWFVGIKLLCAPRDLILEDLAGFIDQHKVTHIDLTPSLGRLLDPELVPSLHSGVFITGGEAVKPEMLKAWGCTGCLFNFYGPTECTIGVTTFPSVPSNGKASNIGWQFDNVGTCVLKPNTDPVIRGGIGELCIFGKLVGKGYLNRPDLTEERFPYMDRLGQRIYRTGDLVRILHDDSIEFLGRADTQVKLRGQRLEIDEIIAVMRQRDVVKDAVCIVARHDETQKDQLIAFVSGFTNRNHASPTVSRNAESATMVSEARGACEERLPGYMVPTHFIPVDFIPLSVNNKQDDKVLKQLYQSLSVKELQSLNQSSNDQRDLDDIERRIADTLATVLEVEVKEIRPSSNIFSLGLNSITALRFARSLKTAGFPSATINIVMQNATISKLGQAMRSSTGVGYMHQEVLNASRSIAAVQQRYLGMVARRLDPDDIKRIAPCTPLQQGLLSRSLRDEGKPYFNRFLFRANSDMLERLQIAFEKLIESTDLFRASFIDSDDGHLQVIPKKGRLHWSSKSVSTEEEAHATLMEAHESWRSSDACGLLQPFRVEAVSSNGSALIQVCIHHALYDGNSWNLMLSRLAALMDEPSNDTSTRDFFDALPHGPLRQVDGCESFWGDQLMNASFQRMQPMIARQGARDTLLTKPLFAIASLEKSAKQLEVTPQSILQAAWIVALAPHHQGPLGLIVSGRSLDIDVDGVIGPMFNTIPFAWSLRKDDTWSTIVQRCHDFNIASLPFHHTPLRSISKWLRLTPESPLFETLFVYQQGQDESNKLSQFLQPLEDETYTADYPISFEADQDAEGRLLVTIGAQKQVCDATFVENLIHVFENNVDALMDDAQAKPTLPDTVFSHTESEQLRTEHKDPNGHHGSFQWTTEAENMRAELAGLANVDLTAVDEHSTLFSLGLDSIDAVKLSSRLRKHNITAPVSVLMRCQTIPKILDAIKTASNQAQTSEDIAKKTMTQQQLRDHVMSRLSDRRDIENVLPATPMQEGLISEMIRSDYKSYFNHDVLRVLPGTDVTKLKSAWEEVVAASPILRTFFLEIDDTGLEYTFAQVIVKSEKLKIDEVTLREDAQITVLLDNIRKDASNTPEVPPFRLTLITKGAEQSLVLSISHALYDGFSLGLLHGAVQQAYEGSLKDLAPCEDVVFNAVESTGSDATALWEATMTQIRPTLLKTRHLNSEAEKYRVERQSILKSSKIKDTCKELGVTVQAACQAAWTLALATLAESLDVTYGLVLAGRDSPEAQQVMFPTMNTVVFRSTLHGTAQDLLKDTQASIVEMVPYQQTPLRHIQKLARKDGRAVAALFNTLFTFQKRPEAGAQTSTPLYESVQGASDVEYPVAIEAELVEDHLIWRAAIKNSVMKSEAADQLLVDVDQYLTQLLSNASRQILTLDGQKVKIFSSAPFTVDLGVDAGLNGGEAELPTSASETFDVVEAKIRDVVAQVARIDPSEVGKDSRLDNLGIDSISAIKVSSILRKQSIDLPVSQLIKAGTVAKAAAMVKSKEQPSQVTSTEENVATMAAVLEQRGLTIECLGLDVSQVERIMPASAGQLYTLGVWAASGGELFQPTFTYRVDGSTDTQAVNAAWKALVERHAILRTTFMFVEGEAEYPLIQVVNRSNAASVGAEWPFVDTAPKLDVVSQEDHIMLKLYIHHALYDAVSLRALMDELAAEVGTKPASQIRPVISMEPFMAESILEGHRSQQKAFWTDYLNLAKSSDNSTLEPTVTGQEPQNMVYSGPRVDVFDPEVSHITADDESKLRRKGISLHALFFAAYGQQYALSHKKQGDVVIGIYLANRSHGVGTPNASIPTVNMVPLRIKLTGSKELEEVARRVQEDLRLISQPPHSSVSLKDIHEWTGVKIDTFVNFVKLPTEDEDAGQGKNNVRITSLDEERELRKRAEVHDEKTKAFDLSHQMQNSGFDISLFPPSIDVEATVRDGRLGIGVFGYESKVTLEQADALIKGVKDRIEEFLA